MLLIAEAIAPNTDDIFDVIREAESIVIQALFDDLVRTIPLIQLGTRTDADALKFRARVDHEAGRMSDGGQKYTVFPWARSPPARSTC